MSRPLISVVVLSWNTKAETEACLESLRKLTYPNKEIVIVDNGSNDGSKEFLEQQKDIVYVDLPINTGFTGGQIEALKHAKGDYIALINSDAVVAKDWIEKGLEVFAKEKKVGAVGGRAYMWNDEFSAYDTSNPFYSYQVVDPVTGYAETLQTGSEIVEVNSISGAGVMVSRRAIEEVGYFDNRFFAYYEETDLFARMKRAGYKVMYTPRIHTWHKIGQSTKGKPFFYLYHMHRNRFMFAYKNFDKEYLKRFRRRYHAEFIYACMKYIRSKRQSVDDKARISAYTWNQSHILATKKERKLTQKLGSTYTSKILEDATQNVTVVIPCYNYGDYVQQAIESALGQTQAPCEVIVINDGSTDDSAEKIKKFTDRITFVDKANEGVIATKNLGLKLAKSSWIVFLDADDILDPDYIQECLRLARTSGKDIVYTDMQLFGAKKERFVAGRYSKRKIKRGNYIHNSALLKTDLVKRVDGYNPAMSDGLEDWEMYLSMIEAGAKPIWLPEPLLSYRQHEPGSRNSAAQENAKILLKRVKELHPRLYGSTYHIENAVKALLRPIIARRRYLKIFWPPTIYRHCKINAARIGYMAKGGRKNKEIFDQASSAVSHLGRAKLRSALLDIKKTRRLYRNLDAPETGKKSRK